MEDSSDGGLLNKFKAAVFGHAAGEALAQGERAASVNGADGFGVLVANENDPYGNFFSVLALVGSRAIKEDSTPRRGGRAAPGAPVCCAQVIGKPSLALIG